MLDTPSLVLPHPRMAWRRFVLQPAAEVAATMLHPIIGWTVARLLEHLDSAACYVAVTGPIAAGKTHLAERLAAAIGGRLIVEESDWERLDRFYADPVRHAWPMEIEFLHKRIGLLQNAFPASPVAQPNRAWTVSDFWFGQSAAFAKAWLSTDQWPVFVGQYKRLQGNVTRPKLIVLLDAPAEELLRRVRESRSGVRQRLTFEELDRLRRAFSDERGEPDVGPVLLARGNDREAIFAEVLAAVRAMELTVSIEEPMNLSAPQLVTTVAQLREALAAVRRAGKTIGFVPTMGALHAGHLSLVRAAGAQCDCVVVSIYVNPSQFGPQEDFSRYPRTLENDLGLLAGCRTDLVFAPADEEVYRPGHATWVEVGPLAELLEGACRPGHFRGVATDRAEAAGWSSPT